MDFIKKNKFILIAIAVFLVLVLLSVQAVNMLFPNVGNAIYGNRLKGEEAVRPDASAKKELTSALEGDGRVKSASLQITGKIMNLMVTVEDEVSVEDARGLSGVALEHIGKEQQNFYDIQIFIKKDSDATNFPIIGYKHSNSENFSWTKDRE